MSVLLDLVLGFAGRDLELPELLVPESVGVSPSGNSGGVSPSGISGGVEPSGMDGGVPPSDMFGGVPLPGICED